MLYSEIKTMFTGLLNRRDITPTLITQFLSLGTLEITRRLRVPPMESLLQYTSDGTSTLPIPADYLEIIAIYANDTQANNKLERRDLQTVLAASKQPGLPCFYHRVGPNMIVGPTPDSGDVLNFYYYADASDLSADTDHNWLTDSLPSLMVYAALVYASDYYMDDRADRFKNRFEEMMDAAQQMANTDELVNASMTPLYPDQTLAVY